jgi:SAM-dependent methyltransferase
LASETSKARARRVREGFFQRYLIGDGIDIGCGADPITEDCLKWDLERGDGDAQLMEGLDGECFNWVYSSHCLEHMVDPAEALQNWWRILRPGGHLIVMVPDEDLYEQGHWPLALNQDHRSTWAWNKRRSWSPISHDLEEELSALPGAEVVSMRLLDTGYDYTLFQHITCQPILSIEQAKQLRAAGGLNADVVGSDTLRNLGFWWLDQSAEPFNAELSLEGIARKT